MFRLCSCISKCSVSVIDTVGHERTNVRHSRARVATPFAVAKADNQRRQWWRRLLDGLSSNSQNESVPSSDGKTKKNGQPKWWQRKKKCRVSPLLIEKTPQENTPRKKTPQENTPRKKTPQENTPRKKTPQEKTPMRKTPQEHVVMVECRSQKEEEKPIISSVPEAELKLPSNVTPRLQHFSCLGFPNPAQICYMNSCLQSLLSLEDFTGDIIRQEQVLRLSPDAAILRSLLDIQRSQFSGEAFVKLRLLSAFKRAVAYNDPEFRNLDQKDAHEFLTSVLNQIRWLTSDLQVLGLCTDQIYSCPVQNNFVFKMHNIRKCKSCHTMSTREEDYTNLSLDLPYGYGTVQEMLENYLEERALQFNCQCGGTKSGQHSSFVNLPRVLILHLKRFSYSSDFKVMKNHDGVILSRDLVVPSNQGGSCYSLVSTINHIGNTTTSGHYICDAVDPDVGRHDVTDRWFTYSDDLVYETNGASVCNKREETSYILFYKRQD